MLVSCTEFNVLWYLFHGHKYYNDLYMLTTTLESLVQKVNDVVLQESYGKLVAIRDSFTANQLPVKLNLNLNP